MTAQKPIGQTLQQSDPVALQAFLDSVFVSIVNWNLPGDTIACIQSLLDAGATPGQIIVVDNGSQDDSVDQLQRTWGRAIDLIESERNLGFAGGNNLAIERALARGASWVLLANNDTLVAPTFFGELAACVREHPDHALIAPLIVYEHATPNQPDVIWSLGDRLLPGTLITRSLLRNRPVPADLPPFIEVDFLNACGLLIRRDVFEDIGLLDERFFMYAEDVDFCWRARRAGYRLGCATRARMRHKVSRSTGVHHPTARYWRVHNQIRIYRRYARGLQQPLMVGFTLARTVWLLLRDLRAGRVQAALRTMQAGRDGWLGHEEGPVPVSEDTFDTGDCHLPK